MLKVVYVDAGVRLWSMMDALILADKFAVMYRDNNIHNIGTGINFSNIQIFTETAMKALVRELVKAGVRIGNVPIKYNSIRVRDSWQAHKEMALGI